MKSLICVFLLGLASATAQTFTTNIQLQLPAHASPNWDTAMNSNFSKIDTTVGTLQALFQGVWVNSTSYGKGVFVNEAGNLYMSLLNSNFNNDPATSPLAWRFMVTAGSGTVASFSAGNLSPIFTTSIANPTSTPSLTFALSNTPTGSGGIVLQQGPSIGAVAINGAGSLPTATGGGGWIAGGFASPSMVRHYCGDNTGWRCEWARRVGGVDTIIASLGDNGLFNVATGFQVGGGGTLNTYLKGNGTNYVPSSGAASGVGACANQVVSATNSDAAPTCLTLLLQSALYANQGTTTTLLHGNAAGNPAFSAVVDTDITPSYSGVGTCTNQFVTATTRNAAPSCTTDVLASAQHANQGTTTTLLHGNAAGNPTFGAVGLTTDVTGTLPTGNGGTGTATAGTTVQVLHGGGAAYGAVGLTTDVTGTLPAGNGGTGTASAGTTTTVLHGGGAAYGAVSLTADVSGNLPVANGGTGSTTTTGTGANMLATGWTSNCKNMNGIRCADQFAGADCGAKVNAADTDLGATAGEIWVSQACGTSWSTAVSLSNLHVLRFVQPGTYITSAALTMGQGSVLAGPGCGGNLCSTVLQEATGANLPVLINGGNQSAIYGLAFDGNKANNPTGGVGVQFSQKQQSRITNVLIQNFKSFGVVVSSTLAGDEGVNPIIQNSLILNNDAGGLNCINTTDGFMAQTQFEQNGLGPQGGTVTTVNTSGTTVTWASGPKWSTDSSLIGTLIRLNNSASTLFQVSAIASTTSLTVTTTPGTLTGVNLYWGDGVFSNNCPGWRYEHSDFGGNGNDGLLMVGSDTGRGSNQNMIVANEFGGNRAHDLEKRGFGTAAYVALQNTISANVFLGSAASIANTFSGIYALDPNLDSINGNIFSAPNRKFGVDFEETAAGRAQKVIMTGNTFASGFGTAIYSTNTQLSTNALGIFANAEGPSGAISFGTGPSSIKFQGGLTSGTGLQHFRQAATCSTLATVNSQCTSTQTLPITMNDTNYSIVGCGLTSVTNALSVGWMGTKTTTSFQVVIVNAAGSAAAATGVLECEIVHD